MSRRLFCAGLVVLLYLGNPTAARATTITLGENGVGTLDSTPLPGVLAADIGPGGLPLVLTYTLPFLAVAGDVLLTDADFGGAFLDVIRFNPIVGTNTTQVAFYSDNVDGFDDLADTVSPPTAFYLNHVFIPETAGGTRYTPIPGLVPQPGFFAGTSALTYVFQSDTEVPEPASLTLVGIGVLGLAGKYARRRRAMVK